MPKSTFSLRHSGSGDAKDEGVEQPTEGQNAVSAEQLQTLLDGLGSQIGDALRTSQPAPQQEQRPFHQQLGLDEGVLNKARESAGGEVVDLLMSGLQAISEQSKENDSVLAEYLGKIQNDVAGRFDKQSKLIKEVGTASGSDSLYDALGFSDTFNDENRDDLIEMFEYITEKSGGLFDAAEEFDRRYQNGDVKYLRQVKEKFTEFSKHKYKDHESMSGGRGTSAPATEESKGYESAIGRIEAAIEKELSRKSRDFNKIEQLNQQLLDLATGDTELPVQGEAKETA